jgi:hypothetical protein
VIEFMAAQGRDGPPSPRVFDREAVTKKKNIEKDKHQEEYLPCRSSRSVYLAVFAFGATPPFIFLGLGCVFRLVLGFRAPGN